MLSEAYLKQILKKQQLKTHKGIVLQPLSEAVQLSKCTLKNNSNKSMTDGGEKGSGQCGQSQIQIKGCSPGRLSNSHIPHPGQLFMIEEDQGQHTYFIRIYSHQNSRTGLLCSLSLQLLNKFNYYATSFQRRSAVLVSQAFGRSVVITLKCPSGLTVQAQ